MGPAAHKLCGCLLASTSLMGQRHRQADRNWPPAEDTAVDSVNGAHQFSDRLRNSDCSLFSGILPVIGPSNSAVRKPGQPIALSTSQTDPPPRLHVLGTNWRPWHLQLKMSLSQKVGCTKGRSCHPSWDVSASGLSCPRLVDILPPWQ